MARTIDVVSLYPKDMNIYGDSGNVLTIRRRLELYGYEPVVHQYNQGDDWPDQVDLILGGGGQDTGQKKIIDDFYHRADLLRSLAADGTPMLMICGLYQLFGEYFETVDGTRLDGIGVIGAYTVGQNVRMIGNLVEHSDQVRRCDWTTRTTPARPSCAKAFSHSAPSIRMAEATMAKTIPRDARVHNGDRAPT